MITNIKIQRNSRQRQVIREIITRARNHPTADQVYLQCREVIPNISLGTVYRNLNQMVAEGEIRALRTGDAIVHYDGNPEPHLHFICRECGQIYDLYLKESPRIEFQPDQIEGHIVEEVKVELYGTCKQCKSKGA